MEKFRQYLKIEIAEIILPPLLTIVFFVVAMFGIVLPAVQSNLMDQKKKMLTAVTQTAWDILAYYDRQAEAGKISSAEARDSAIRQLRGLQYGPENKDYFWLHDTKLRMVMHPYRPEMEGKDLAAYTDPDGKLLFVEMASVAGKHGEGFVNYRWQWKDDATQVVPKLSYVKLFKPWGLVLGTGVYLEDIRKEAAIIRREMIAISAAILTLIVLLSFYIMRAHFMELSRRRTAEEELKAHKDQLEELVEKRTRELREALSKVKVLSGFLPICSSCKNIRDDKGYWNQIESYIRDHSEAEFSHGICPRCAEKLYPELYDRADPGKG